MQTNDPLPHLFRTEYRKIVSVLCRLFGIDHIEVAEDLVSETFLAAAELWGSKGLPENPTAWLYSVAKNKTKNYLKHNQVFAKKVVQDLKHANTLSEEIDPDLSVKNINDSQLAMIFAVCDPCIAPEAQIGLALNLLCGFGAEEIAVAFLTNKETVYKRLQRAKERLKAERIKIEQPQLAQINERLPNVLTTVYLLFNEGYYSVSQSQTLRKDLCLEAMRLAWFLSENEVTNTPSTNALLSLMCFHASRFEARTSSSGEMVLYNDQDPGLWDQELVGKGNYFLNKAYTEGPLSKYHFEAAIAYWHTQKNDTPQKWNNILQLYNRLLQINYSPIIALNRTYALGKAHSPKEAIAEAEKLKLNGNQFYHSLLGTLYTATHQAKALQHFEAALALASTPADKAIILKKMEQLR